MNTIKNPLIIPCAVLAVISVVTTAAAVKVNSDNSKLLSELADINIEPVVITVPSETTETTFSEEEKFTESETSAPETEYAPPHTDENTIYIYDNGIDVIEYPAIENAVLNDYNMELLKTDDGKRKTLYNSDGEKRSRFGIDVSSHQGSIDWQAAADDGVEFAIIRIGYRGYETGTICADKYFMRNIEGAQAAGIDTGVYFYSQALNTAEAEAEAEYVINTLKENGYTVTMPVVFDWEFATDEDPARTDGMDPDIQNECCKAFCKKIAEAGYDTMYYATIDTSIFRYKMGELSEYPLWMAEYSAETDFVYDYKMWQYSCSGVVDGIDSLVDLNIYIDK